MLEPPSAAVFPIDGIPSTHPKVTRNVCGEQFTAEQKIPATGLWSTSGASDPSDSSCVTQPSGQLFYGYNFPSGSSGNTGYVVPSAIALYMVMDENLAVYLVISLDAPGSTAIPNSQKRLAMSVTSTGLVGLDTPPALVQADDPGEVTTAGHSLWHNDCRLEMAFMLHGWCGRRPLSLRGLHPHHDVETLSTPPRFIAEHHSPPNAIQIGSYNAAGNSIDFVSADMGATPYQSG